MIILGIETTCDETAAALVERTEDGEGRILSNIVLSQVSEHAEFGGVVPEIAARAHVEALDHVIAKAMAEANVSFEALDGVAAAAGPGLIGGVIVGLTTAKAIALTHDKPLIAVNHLEAHALTARLTDGTPFPYCLFLASGGHTQILAVRGVGDYVRFGGTVDDAIGEAFDKTAKLLGLGYPGGPQVEKEATHGDAKRFALPRPMAGRRDADFSLSGLKTALRLEAEKVAPLSDQDVADLCASFQQAVVDVVMDRLRAGLRMFRERAIRQLTSKDSSVTFNPVDGEAPVVDLSASGGAGGSLTLTDGTNTVNDVTQIAVSGATVGGSTPDATLTIPAGNSTQVIGVNSFPYTISSGAGLTQISVYAGSSAVTVNLPATPAVNQMVRVVDAGNTAATGTITINGNGQTISAYGGTQSSIEIASNGGDIWLGWDTEGEQWS